MNRMNPDDPRYMQAEIALQAHGHAPRVEVRLTPDEMRVQRVFDAWKDWRANLQTPERNAYFTVFVSSKTALTESEWELVMEKIRADNLANGIVIAKEKKKRK